MITLRSAPPSRAASATTADVRPRPCLRSPDLSAPIAMTMSISRAPSRMARRASSALISDGVAPSGKPTTVQTSGDRPRGAAAQRLTWIGFTQTEAKPYCAASSQSLSISRVGGVGLEERVVDERRQVLRHLADAEASPRRGSRSLRRTSIERADRPSGAPGRAVAAGRAAGAAGAPAQPPAAGAEERRVRRPGSAVIWPDEGVAIGEDGRGFGGEDMAAGPSAGFGPLGVERVDHRDPPLVAVDGAVGGEEDVDDLQARVLGEVAGAEGQDVGVVVLPRVLRGRDVEGHRRRGRRGPCWRPSRSRCPRRRRRFPGQARRRATASAARAGEDGVVARLGRSGRAGVDDVRSPRPRGAMIASFSAKPP